MTSRELRPNGPLFHRRMAPFCDGIDARRPRLSSEGRDGVMSCLSRPFRIGSAIHQKIAVRCRRSVIPLILRIHPADGERPGSAINRHSPQFGPAPTAADSSKSAIGVKADSPKRADPCRIRSAALSPNESGYSRNSPNADALGSAILVRPSGLEAAIWDGSALQLANGRLECRFEVTSGGLFRGEIKPAFDSSEGCCQTNANQSQFARVGRISGRAKLTPLSESGGSVELEYIPAG